MQIGAESSCAGLGEKCPGESQGKRATEEATSQARCRGGKSWPERCWSKGDLGIVPVATKLRCNPTKEEDLM